MFTKDTIIAVQQENVTFPNLVAAFKHIGMVSNTVMIQDGKAVYRDGEGTIVELPGPAGGNFSKATFR